MVGRASLYVILGFSLIFGIAGQYWNRESIRAVENFMTYYDSTMAHNIVMSAANIACDTTYFGGWSDSLSTTPMPSGYFSGGNSTIDHKRGSYTISSKTVPWDGYKYLYVVVASKWYRYYKPTWGFFATPDTMYDSIKIVFQPWSFSEFAYFSGTENGVDWANGDTVWGPFHTEGAMNITGNPVFHGRATWVGTPTKPPSGTFLGGWEQGAATHVTVPPDISTSMLGVTKTSTFSPGYTQNTNFTTSSLTADVGTNYGYDVYLTFGTDGSGTPTVTVSDKQSKYSTTTHTWTTVNTTAAKTIPLSSMKNSDSSVVILVKNGDAHVSGTVAGNVTVVADTASGSSLNGSTTKNTTYYASGFSGSSDGSAANIIIEGNTTYKNSSTDMLGLVAYNNVALNTQTYTSKGASSVTIDAAIFALKGMFSYIDWNGSVNSNDFMGYIYLMGSITQSSRGAVATLSGSNVSAGYSKDYTFDQRFYTQAPPYYPVAPRPMQIVSWLE